MSAHVHVHVHVYTCHRYTCKYNTYMYMYIHCIHVHTCSCTCTCIYMSMTDRMLHKPPYHSDQGVQRMAHRLAEVRARSSPNSNIMYAHLHVHVHVHVYTCMGNLTILASSRNVNYIPSMYSLNTACTHTTHLHTQL